MPVFEANCSAGTALRKMLGIFVLLGFQCSSLMAQTPLFLAAPDDNPAQDERLSHILPQEERVVAEPTSAAGPGPDALRGARAAIAHAALTGRRFVAVDEISEIAACDAGILKRVSTDGRPASILSEIFASWPGRRPGKSACALMYEFRFETLAYRLDAFPVSPPTTGLAVFDTASFPGRRAVVWPPRALLEWAMLERGVPKVQVYDILSSARGIQLAREAILDIAPSIIWVESDVEAARLLATGEVSIAVGNAADLALTAGIAVVLQAGKIGQRRSWIKVPGGAAMADTLLLEDAIVVALTDDASTNVPALWRDAAWYANAGAHVGTGLTGLGPER